MPALTSLTAKTKGNGGETQGMTMTDDRERKAAEAKFKKSDRATEGANPSNITAAGGYGRRLQITAADQFASGLLPVIEAIRTAGATTLEAITRALNERGIRSARGTRWYASSVANLSAGRTSSQKCFDGISPFLIDGN
jgi:hypothetical protein